MLEPTNSALTSAFPTSAAPLSLSSSDDYASDLSVVKSAEHTTLLNPVRIDREALPLWKPTQTNYFEQSLFESDFSQSDLLQTLPQTIERHTESLSIHSAEPFSAKTDSLTGQSANILNEDDLLFPQSRAQSSGSQSLKGSLRADRFFADLNNALTVISGNGNVDYGDGLYDYLDLSHVSTQSVANWSLAESGGVIFNAGGGDRVFDYLQLSNGSEILFEGLDAVQFADRTVDLTINPNDPFFGEQWNLHMMGVHNAWRFTQGSEQILVGVQDSGLGYNHVHQGFHPDIGNPLYFSDNVADEFFREVPGEAGPQDASHGTSVHSIIAAKSNNGYGMSGINWNASVFNIDVLDNNRNDKNLAAAAQDMINEANSRGQKLIVNMSLGGYAGVDPHFETLVANNQDKALFVIAAGNDSVGRLADPASLSQKYGNVIAVGASWGTRGTGDGQVKTPGDRIQYNWWGSNYGNGLSLMGPSEVIAAVASPSSHEGANFDWTSDFIGTSAAAPNVAGVASLVWSVNPNLSANQVHSIMAETAYDLGQPGYDVVTGSGFVNADAAVRRAMAIARTGQQFSPFSLVEESENSSFSTANWLATNYEFTV